MKKGLPRIIIGCILIVFQLLSVIGNSLTGNHLGISFTNVYVFIYDLIGLLTYYFLGILGVVLLISGLVVYNRKDKVPREKSKNAPRSFFDDTTSISNGRETAEARAAHNPVQHSNQKELSSNTSIKHGKHKYCSRCGSRIDSISKKCTGCGKQFFSIVHFQKFIMGTIVIFICVAFLLLVKNNFVLQQTLEERETLIAQLYKENDELLSQHEELEVASNAQYGNGYSAGKEEGYKEGYLQGQLDNQQQPQDTYDSIREELRAKYGNN